MNKLLFASAAAVAMLAAAPAFAGTGQVDLGYTDINSPFGDGNMTTIGGAAVVDAGGWSIQGDAAVHRLDGGSSNINFSDATLHLFKRNDSWAAGAYVNASDFSMADSWGVGVEGAKYFENSTISASLGWNKVDGGFADADGWNATLGATVFPTDNFSMGVDLGRLEIDDVAVNSWGVNGEYKPEVLPVSLFASYTSKNEGVFGEDSHSWTVGARWNFGGGTLKQRDRSGASMKGGMNFTDLLF